MTSSVTRPIVVFGASGQLGTDLVVSLKGRLVVPATHQEVDVTDRSQVDRFLDRVKPDWVINAVAYNDVPGAERTPADAFRLNGWSVGYLADACTRHGCAFVHFSTDYVFSGMQRSPYVETDVPGPVNVYGISKLAGEFFARQTPKHYVARVAALYGRVGARGKGGSNFVKTILRKAKAGEAISVSSNIVTSTTYTVDAAQWVSRLMDHPPAPGIFHVTNRGGVTWFEFAQEIVKAGGYRTEVSPKVESAESASVVRPQYSVLASQKTGDLRPWREALTAFVAEWRSLGEG